jgi:hypothetical protein
VNDDADLERRLRDLGGAPVDPVTAQAHRAAMAAATARPSRRFGAKAVAAAAIAGFLAGSTGLAAAGALPDPAQDVAHDVLDVVGIGVPRSTEDCPEGSTFRNHGEYVSSVDAAGGDVEAAARSRCGKPTPGGAKGNGPGGAARADADGDPCTGPPPWAGSDLSPEDKAAARAERQAACGTEDAAEAPESEDDRAEVDDDADLDESKAPTEVDETTSTTTAAPDATTTTEATTTSTTSSTAGS